MPQINRPALYQRIIWLFKREGLPDETIKAILGNAVIDKEVMEKQGIALITACDNVYCLLHTFGFKQIEEKEKLLTDCYIATYCF